MVLQLRLVLAEGHRIGDLRLPAVAWEKNVLFILRKK